MTDYYDSIPGEERGTVTAQTSDPVPETTTLGQDQCVLGCTDVELGQICTLVDGVYATGRTVSCCDIDSQCNDGVMHRTAERGWHTCQGTEPAQWWAENATLLNCQEAS